MQILRALLISAVATMAAACGIDTAGSQAQPTPGPSASTRGFSWAIERLPDTEQVRSLVIVNDYSLIREIATIDLPPADATDDEIRNYVRKITGNEKKDCWNDYSKHGNYVGPIIDGFGRCSEWINSWRRQVGFTAADVDRAVISGRITSTSERTSESPGYQVFAGRFDYEEIEYAVNNDSDWNDLLETVGWNGAEYFSWGGDNPVGDAYRASYLRGDGRGHRMLATEDTVLWAQTTQDMRDLIDVSDGSLPGLASNEDFALMARVLDEERVYSGFMTDVTPDIDDGAGYAPAGTPANQDTEEERRQRIAEMDLITLDQFDAFAAGVTYENYGYSTVFVIVFSSTAEAEANAPRALMQLEEGRDRYSGSFGASWSNRFRSPEVRTEGRVLIVKARVEDHSEWMWPMGGRPTYTQSVFFHE